MRSHTLPDCINTLKLSDENFRKQSLRKSSLSNNVTRYSSLLSDINIVDPIIVIQDERPRCSSIAIPTIADFLCIAEEDPTPVCFFIIK